MAVLEHGWRLDEIGLPLFLHGPRDRLCKDIRLPMNVPVPGFDGAQMRDGLIGLALRRPVLPVACAPQRYGVRVFAAFAQPGRRTTDGIEVSLFWIAHANPRSTQHSAAPADQASLAEDPMRPIIQRHQNFD